ncbi:MAG: hypothetical protein U0470_02720 [Anaerolineae bacterium]
MNGGEHLVARRLTVVSHLDERPRLEVHQQPADVVRRNGRAAADRFGGAERPAASEDAQSAEQHLFALGQQSEAHRERCQERLVSPSRGGRAIVQQPEPIRESIRDLRQREDARSRRRQLDGQRNPIELPTDVDDQGHLAVVVRRHRPSQGRPVYEEPHGIVVQRLSGCRGRLRARHRHRRHRERRLAAHTEPNAACGEHLHQRTSPQHGLCEVGGRGH